MKTHSYLKLESILQIDLLSPWRKIWRSFRTLNLKPIKDWFRICWQIVVHGKCWLYNMFIRVTFFKHMLAISLKYMFNKLSKIHMFNLCSTYYKLELTFLRLHFPGLHIYFSNLLFVSMLYHLFNFFLFLVSFGSSLGRHFYAIVPLNRGFLGC